MRLLAFLVCAASAAQAAVPQKSHHDFREEADAAVKLRDYATARDATAAALRLRPDSPRYLYNLAALSILTGDEPAAFSRLRELASLGVYLPAERDPNFATLQGRPEFMQIVAALAANRMPKGEADILCELPGRTGIIEGIAYRPRTGDMFFGDVHFRCVWKRDRNGQITRFTAEDDELFGVFGIAIDEPRNTLWAATAALPEMSGFSKEMKGQTALAEFNLTTGELRRVVPVPGDGRDHLLGDLAIASDGTIYATDSSAPVIWRLAPGGEEIERYLESTEFGSLQGILFVNHALLVADYSNGLFAIDLPAGIPRALVPLPKTTLLGLDGLVAAPAGIFAVQNGVNPQRILHIALAPDMKSIRNVSVIAASLPNLTDLTLITVVNDRPTVIAGAGWDDFDPAKSEHPRPHSVRIFQPSPPAAGP